MRFQEKYTGLAVGMLLQGMIATVADADVIRVAGTVTEVPDRVAESAVTVLDFQLTQFRAGEGLYIVSAVIDWDHPGVTEHSTVRYTLFDPQISSRRGGFSPSTFSQIEELLAEDPASSGVVYPQDYERLGKGHLRFPVETQVRRVLESQGNEFQVVVATSNMSPSTLARAGGVLPFLTIRYGFLGNMKEAFTPPILEK